MSNDWRERLKQAIKDDGRSLRAISAAADKVGENYLQQMLKDEKDPGFSRLSRVLAELGPAATVFVTSGVRLDEPATIPRERMLETLMRMEGVTERRAELAMLALAAEPTPAPPIPEQPGSDGQSGSATRPRESASSSSRLKKQRAPQRQRG